MRRPRAASAARGEVSGPPRALGRRTFVALSIAGTFTRRSRGGHAAVMRWLRVGHAADTRDSPSRAGASVAAPPPVGAGPAPDRTSLATVIRPRDLPS